MDVGVQIVSDGTGEGTHVLLDGKPVRGVTSVTWQVGIRDRRARLVLELEDIEIDASARISPEVEAALQKLADGFPDNVLT